MSEHPADEVVYINGENRNGIAADVMATLCQVISLAYPDAMMGPGDPIRGGFSLRIPRGGRKPRVTKKSAQAATVHADDSDGGRIVGMGEDGSIGLILPKDASAALAEFAFTVLDSSDATNYVEIPVTHNDGRRFVVIAAWTPKQTPHQLRMAAEAQLAKLTLQEDQ